MNIVILELDHHERTWLKEQLLLNFPGSDLKTFEGIGLFLEEYQTLKKPFILILETLLPLYQINKKEENQDSRVDRLKRSYPWIGEDWELDHGGEVLIRGIKKLDPNQFIVVYTNFPVNLVPQDIRNMPLLHVCVKEAEVDNLARVIRRFKPR